MVRVLLLPILIVLMAMMAALLFSVDVYHLGRSLLPRRGRGKAKGEKNPTG